MSKVHLKYTEDGIEYLACDRYPYNETTFNPLEVTCKNCQRTDEYKKAMEKLKIESEEAKVEKSYEERQAEWIKKKDIKVGDKVEVLRKAETGESGWGTTWEPEMDVYVEVAGEVTLVDGVVGVAIEFSNGCEYFFPYFVLEKVTEPPSTLTEAKPKKIDLLANLEEICGDGWVHTIVENYKNGHLIISEATWQDKPYLNLHTLDYEQTSLTTIVIVGAEAMERLRDILIEML